MRPLVARLACTLRGSALLALCAGLVPFAVACGGAGQGERFEASADAKRYDLTGAVRAVKKGERSLTVAHAPIEGLMSAMTMDFVVADAWVLDAAAAGDRITATLVLDGARAWLESVAISKGQGDAAAAPDGVHLVDPGTPLPDVSLVDQAGRTVSTSTYAGQPAVYTFIYTRCPLPEYCPLMMRRFNAIAERLEAEGRRDDVWLVAVTLDPDFDQPAVLKAFGDRMLEAESEADRYTRTALVTGDPSAIRALAAAVQLTYDREGGEIVHGLRTVVVDAEGRVVRAFQGSDWTVDEVLAAIGQAG